MRKSLCGIIWLAAMGAAPILEPVAQIPSERAVEAPGAQTFDARARAEAMARIKAQIRASYVYPERTEQLVQRLSTAEKSGRYDTADASVFADRVTEDLQADTRDSHLYLHYDPQWFASAQNAPPDDADERQIEIERDIARHTNHGLVEMRILPGNIRYLKIEGFGWVADETGPAYDAAMHFVKDGRAIILDLRGNRGGWIQASKYLISHFLPPNTLIATFYSADGESEQYRAVDYLPSGRMGDRPAYLLIDGHSRSAAEMVAYTFQQYKLGELIGAKTEGAANVSDDFPVAPGFRLSISTGRTVQPISHGDWEGVGIAPTVPTDPARALEVAQLRAIDRLLPATPEGVPRFQLEWARPAIEAALHPAILSETQLRQFAGEFGDVQTRISDHALWLHRPGRPASRLAPMTRDGLFQSLDNATLRVKISRDHLDLLRLDPAYSTRHAK
ncbi:MAG: S41 family peptidase [Sphingopyxis sp.]|nr:S41 family peptidase [Sphingopyxis sp.]